MSITNDVETGTSSNNVNTMATEDMDTTGGISLRREIGTFLAFTGIVIPIVVCMVAIIFGGLLAATQGWWFSDGFFYVMVDILGMDISLTDATPTGTGGVVWDCFLTFWSYGFTVVMFSFLFEMALCKRNLLKAIHSCVFHVDIPDVYDEQGRFIVTRKRLLAEFKVCLAFIFIFVPLLIGIIAVILGGILAAIEGWSFGDGALFLIDNMCSLANSLTDVEPDTTFNIFAVIIIDCWALAVLGSFIGFFIASGVTRSWVEAEKRFLYNSISL